MEVRIIDGAECTDRAGIAEALAPRSTATLNTYASTDPNFPQPIRDGQRIDRRKWYRLADVQAYQQRLNQRREELKPPPVAPGNPNDMLDIPAAAEAIGVTVGRFRSYISASIPAWERGQDGYLPRPDEEEALGPRRTRRRWKRATLAAHRASRTGQGAPGAAGHPVGAPPHRRGRQPYSPELLTQVRQLEADAVAQGERLTGPQLADLLGVPVHTAYRLLTAAHTRIDGDDPKAD